MRKTSPSSGILTSFRNNFTTNPVSNADMIVPSLVPTMVKSKKDKYAHLGLKHVNTRTLAEKSFMYDLVREA